MKEFKIAQCRFTGRLCVFQKVEIRQSGGGTSWISGYTWVRRGTVEAALSNA